MIENSQSTSVSAAAINQLSQLQIVSDLTALDHVLVWFDHLLLPSMGGPVWDHFWVQCKTILAEGFTNAVRHAHRTCPRETLVTIAVTLEPQALELCIWDQGPPFDLQKKLMEIKSRHDLYADGGRGLMIMDSLADQLEYGRLPDQRNCLRVRKAYPAGLSIGPKAV